MSGFGVLADLSNRHSITQQARPFRQRHRDYFRSHQLYLASDKLRHRSVRASELVIRQDGDSVRVHLTEKLWTVALPKEPNPVATWSAIPDRLPC